jgi:hypothetical protein
MFLYNFPEIQKNIPERKQLEKISEEWIEFLTSKDEDEKYMEFLDFCHCIETYARRFMNQEKLEIIKKKVIEKNLVRGYYKKV